MTFLVSVESAARLFADDTKMYREVSTNQDRDLLQTDIKLLEEWSAKWQLPFNKDKCKLMHVGSSNPGFSYQMEGASIAAVTNEKDLGIIIDNSLKFHEQTAAAVARANRILGLIKRAFSIFDATTLPLLFKAMVRPHLEYANSVWGPTLRMEQDAIERVLRRATKLVRSLRNLKYEDRLQILKIPSMYYRRLRGDMIMVFQILTGRLKPGSNRTVAGRAAAGTGPASAPGPSRTMARRDKQPFQRPAGPRSPVARPPYRHEWCDPVKKHAILRRFSAALSVGRAVRPKINSVYLLD